ncbi:3-phosphoshikimate 1-carboxyvinyltransferase [Saccharospirillum impatiens]|uniref:3-phosphoshikimate 1-carboxyvinyltransferase n=1 Tax=Saccharospirillum impatiens TaxID=169438 RepID=UPI0004220806|nr:3-phosphoshikimate 1-carboxyvinyltransferase [Saccharospirillum impatiens]
MTVGPTKPRVLIVGLGMIGASFAKALSLSQSATVIGLDAQPGVAEKARAMGIVDEAVTFSELKVSFDVVILAVPVLAMGSVLAQLKPWLTGDTVISDVGSVKGAVVEATLEALGELPSGFVPGHPIAGAERSGLAAAKSDLFDHHLLILTPLPTSSPTAVQLLTRLWQSVGADVVTMSVARHDEVLAATSHLPHLLAFSLVDTLARESENREIFRYAAGGFRDFTRIAASDPTMWHDVFLANREATLNILRRFQADLDVLADAIENREGDTLKSVFGRAKSARDYFTEILSSRQRHGDDIRKNLIAAPVRSGLTGQVEVPGDRSISHRAVILAALAEGQSQLRGFGSGSDNRTTLEALRKLGVCIEADDAGGLLVTGVGRLGLKAADSPLYMGNSATSMRLLAGVLSAQSFSSELIGDASLSQRPMERIQQPLQQMGARVDLSARKTAPVVMHPVTALEPLDYRLPMASAQVKTTLLLAGLCSGVSMRLQEAGPSRNHTELLLKRLGCPVHTDSGVVTLGPTSQWSGFNCDIPGDFSLAAVHLAAASLVPDSHLTVTGVGVNPSRLGLLAVLARMGARIRLMHHRDLGGEPVADIQVDYAPLVATDSEADVSGLTIDEFPLLFVLATQAQGVSRFSGIRELRFKETDRLKTMVEGLTTLGADIELKGGAVIIRGQNERPLDGGIVDCGGDHRVALAYVVAAQTALRPVIIRNSGRVLSAYPDFAEHALALGYSVTVED